MFRYAILLAALALPLAAQQPEPIEHPAPEYPPIARAAHVTGIVVLQVTIDADGNVTAIEPVSGPEMLRGAAVDGVRRWRFAPARNRLATAPSTFSISVPFGVGAPRYPEDEKIARDFFSLSEECHKKLAAPAGPASPAAACVHAAEVAATFSDQKRFIERRSAFVYAASALLREKRPQEALTYAEKAVAVVAQGRDDSSGSNAAYAVRAQAEAFLGNLSAADADMATAEAFERSAIHDLGKNDAAFVLRAYVPVLKGQLRFHAQILTALDKPADAAAKQAEADKL